MPLKPTGFWSYTSTDDAASGGRLSQLRRLLNDQLQQHIGRLQKVHVFQDVAAIPAGTAWDAQIHGALRDSSFLIPIVTPAFLQSPWCCKEVRLFHALMRERGRDDLILPVHYMDVGAFETTRRDECADPAVYDYLRTRQWLDCRSVRLLEPSDPRVRPELEKIATAVRDTLYRKVPPVEVPALPPLPEPAPDNEQPAPPPPGPDPVHTQVPPRADPPPPPKRSWVASLVGLALLVGLVVVGLVASGHIGGSPPPAKIVETPKPPAPAVVEAPKPMPVVKPKVAEPEMARIPAGSFTIGSSDEEDKREGVPAEYAKWSKPQRTVSVAAFELAKNTVTRGEFAAFVRANPDKRPLPGCWNWKQQADKSWRWENDPKADWEHPGFDQTDEHPAVCLSYDDAVAYIGWVNTNTESRPYRLPSEAEWEYAARGRASQSRARFWGDGRDPTCTYANVADKTAVTAWPAADDPKRFFGCSDGFAFTAPVRHFLPNDYGLYDMLGNVWQWTSDCWHENYDDMRNNGTFGSSGDCGLRALRGGSWGSGPWSVRSGNRYGIGTGVRDSNNGFPLARTL